MFRLLKRNSKLIEKRLPQSSNFILTFIGRAGSSYVIDMLNSHPNIHAQGELLVKLKSSEEERKKFEEVYNSIPDPLIKTIGFKTKMTDVSDLNQFTQMLDEFNLKVIYLYRHNIVKQTISRLNRKRLHAELRLHNLRKGVEQLPPFVIPLNDFRMFFDQTLQRSIEIQNYMNQLKRPQLRIAYEDILSDSNLVFLRIFDFLEIEPKPLTSCIVKNTKDNLQEVVLNYDELSLAYKDTKYAEMF